MSQTLQSVLCITTNKYLVHVLVVLLHARFSVVGPIPFLLAAIFFSGHPYIGSTTVLPDYSSRLQIAPSILITFHIKKDTRHVQLEFQGTATVSYSTRHRNSTNDSK